MLILFLVHTANSRTSCSYVLFTYLSVCTLCYDHLLNSKQHAVNTKDAYKRWSQDLTQTSTYVETNKYVCVADVSEKLRLFAYALRPVYMLVYLCVCVCLLCAFRITQVSKTRCSFLHLNKLFVKKVENNRERFRWFVFSFFQVTSFPTIPVPPRISTLASLLSFPLPFRLLLFLPSSSCSRLRLVCLFCLLLFFIFTNTIPSTPYFVYLSLLLVRHLA